MTKKEQAYIEEKKYLEESITDMNVRQEILLEKIERLNREIVLFTKDHERLEKKLEKHLAKYGIKEEEDD